MIGSPPFTEPEKSRESVLEDQNRRLKRWLKHYIRLTPDFMIDQDNLSEVRALLEEVENET